ncbi:MAG: hypothetical protein MUC47_08010 [Candidatus Kapabacteria bacterium]|jgi:hypothetical protein|nr:hypothetical protein [Candidatus Kapabacteria bacterium]
MAHDTHAHGSHDHGHADHGHGTDVNDSMANRLLGILSAIVVVAICIAVAKTMHWHTATIAAMTGILGMVIGAGGTAANGPNLAAYLGWTGSLLFFYSLASFLGLTSFLY